MVYISILENFTNHDLNKINALLKVTLGECHAWLITQYITNKIIIIILYSMHITKTMFPNRFDNRSHVVSV